MTTKQLHNRWLRTKRHLRSMSDNPRAVHAAALAAEHTPSRGGLCRPERLAA